MPLHRPHCPPLPSRRWPPSLRACMVKPSPRRLCPWPQRAALSKWSEGPGGWSGSERWSTRPARLSRAKAAMDSAPAGLACRHAPLPFWRASSLPIARLCLPSRSAEGIKAHRPRVSGSPPLPPPSAQHIVPPPLARPPGFQDVRRPRTCRPCLTLSRQHGIPRRWPLQPSGTPVGSLSLLVTAWPTH